MLCMYCAKRKAVYGDNITYAFQYTPCHIATRQLYTDSFHPLLLPESSNSAVSALRSYLVRLSEALVLRWQFLLRSAAPFHVPFPGLFLVFFGPFPAAAVVPLPGDLALLPAPALAALKCRRSSHSVRQSAFPVAP